MHQTNLPTIRRLTTVLLFLFLSCLSSLTHADPDVISLFPIENYNQTITDWIKPDDTDYDKPLLSAEMQQFRMNEFYNHYFGSASPWNEDYVNRLLKHAAPDDLKTQELSLLSIYSNKKKSVKEIGYGENYRPHTQAWIDAIAENINLAQLEYTGFHASQRAIAVDNSPVRALPTTDVHFYHYKLPGQGFPFDNLQMSALWAGTPVYIISESQDHAWLLVLTPDFIGWVKSAAIARTNDAFVQQWQNAAKNKLAAITQTQTSLTDDNGQYLLSAYVGAVFPAINDAGGIKLMIPAANLQRHAVVKNAVVTTEQAALMPLAATPHHFAMLMQTLIGRPYGWGGMYFYNDCSAELKSLFTPFGIWLPRHSSDQMNTGKKTDLGAYSAIERTEYLKHNGRKMMTIVYNGGHVFLYLGNFKLGSDNTLTAMTYQNMWGLSPKPSTRRAVIGQSVMFPLLLQYPEDLELRSQAAKKNFQMSSLDELPAATSKLRSKINMMILRTLMFPNPAGVFGNFEW